MGRAYPGGIWDKLPFIERFQSFQQLGFNNERAFNLAFKKWNALPISLRNRLRDLG